MKLYQEYLNRYDLKDIPVVQHTDYGTVFFRGQNPDGMVNWRLLLIQFHSDGNHPGQYIIKWMSPVHDGRSRSNMFQNYPAAVPPIEWDQYEEYMLDLVKHPPDGLIPVRRQPEIVLTAWEMFVFAHDSEMARYANKESLYKSLDTDLSFVERHQGFQEIIYDIERNADGYFQAWSRDMMNYIRKYCHWLADLCANGKQ